MSDKPDRLPTWGLAALSWLVSFYFLIGFAANVGFPPDRKVMLADALYVVLWLFFLFLPFFSKVKFAHFLELEREVTRTKDELHEFKSEMRNTISVLSTNVNTIGGMNNTLNFNFPSLAELQGARESVANRATPEALQAAHQVKATIREQSEEDSTLALARTRIEIEGLLRKILGKRMDGSESTEGRIRYAGILQLFDMLTEEYPDLLYLRKPLRYSMQVCNEAIHAQRVSDERAQEALTLGAEIIGVLRAFANDMPSVDSDEY